MSAENRLTSIVSYPERGTGGNNRYRGCLLYTSFALMPFLMSDVEFDETFQEYYDQFIAGYPDMAKATESMAILCDNA